MAGGGVSIDDGSFTPSVLNATDFGSVASLTNSANHTFTITNTGNADLHLTGSPAVSITGPNAADFTILSQPATTIAGGSASNFQIMFHPSAAGLRTAYVTVPNDDATEGDYQFTIQGTGLDTGASEVVVDDSTPGTLVSLPFVTNLNSAAYLGEVRSDGGGSGADHVIWTFNSLAPGTYTVYSTWTPFGNRATNAPYTIADGSVSQSTVSANQQLAPADETADGVSWKASRPWSSPAAR